LRRGLYQINITRHKVKATIHPAITADMMKSIFKGFGLIRLGDGELVPFVGCDVSMDDGDIYTSVVVEVGSGFTDSAAVPVGGGLSERLLDVVSDDIGALEIVNEGGMYVAVTVVRVVIRSVTVVVSTGGRFVGIGRLRPRVAAMRDIATFLLTSKQAGDLPIS
jgi:hypothetical protein